MAALVFPPDGHLTKDSGLTVMLYAEEKDAKVLTLTGGAGEITRRDVQKGFNRLDLEIKAGENILRWGEETRKVWFAAGAAAPPAEYKAHYLHEALDDCQNCHVAKGKELKSQEPELCFECHDDPRTGKGGAKKSVHDPVSSGECSACHKPHVSSQPKLLVEAVPALCAGCHDSVTANKEGKPFAQQHEPVQAGDCLDCHLAHASDSPALTKAEGGKLCADCHDDPTVLDGAKKKSIHEPVASGECLSCHKVHGSGTPKLLTMPIEDLCKDCHEVPDTSDKGTKYAFPHDPVESGECLSCHDAHAASNAKLTKAEGASLCLECHDDPRKGKDGKEFPVPHPALDDGCLPCHKPHGSDIKALLSGPGTTLCMECHDDARLDKNGFLLQYLHEPVATGNCSGCHQPHGGSNPRLLLAKGNKLCLSCHQDFHPNHRTSEVTRDTERAIGGTLVPDSFPLEKPGFDLSCRGCHQHHGSQNESLLVTDRDTLCAKCHKF